MQESTNEEIITALIEHENSLCNLYRNYSACVTNKEEFWNRFADDEKSHASMLEALKKQLQSGGLYFENREFNTTAIFTSIKYINRNLTDPGEEVTQIKALATALSFERTIIERDFFRIFESDSVEMKKTFKMLDESTSKHRRVMEDAYKEAQKSNS